MEERECTCSNQAELINLLRRSWITSGLMMAKGFAANGAKVYIGGRRKEIVDKVAAESVKDAGPGKIVA